MSSVAWPLHSNVIRKHKISNTFGMVRHYANGDPKPHQGWDLAASVGTTTYAIADGTIVLVANGGDYGIRVCMSFIYQGQQRYAFYAHLEHAAVTPGQTVHMKDLIGKTGKTGNAYNMPPDEEHLHFEIRTVPSPGLGLAGRVSPLTIYGMCPLQTAIQG